MRAEKQYLLDEIKQAISEINLMIFLQYKGVTANQMADFRKALLDQGGRFRVMSKRMLMRAAKDVGLSLGIQALEGHIGIVTSKDQAIGATKFAFKFKESFEEAVEILGGQFEGQTCTSADLKKVADLPSQEVMRAQCLAVLEAPMAGMLAACASILAAVPTLLANKKSTL